MGFIQAGDSNISREDEGEVRPIILTHPAAFRETAYRRWRRQATTLARAVRAGHARAKADPARGVAPGNVGDAVGRGRAMVPVPALAPPRDTSWPAAEPPASAGGSTRNDLCSPTTRPRSAGRRRHVWSAPGSSRKPSHKQATWPVSSGESSSSMGTRSYACSDRRTGTLSAARRADRHRPGQAARNGYLFAMAAAWIRGEGSCAQSRSFSKHRCRHVVV